MVDVFILFSIVVGGILLLSLVILIIGRGE